MAVRRSMAQPISQQKADSFSKKYSLKARAGLDKENKDAFVIPLGLADGVYTLACHEVRKAVDGVGFRGLTFNSRIACHRVDKSTGEVSKELPLCCQIMEKERERLGKQFSTQGAITWAKNRVYIPVLVLSNTETDPNKRLSSRKVSITHGIDFSFIDMAEYTYSEFIKTVKNDMENDEKLNIDSIPDEEMYEKASEYIRKSIIKISTIQGKISETEKIYKVIPFTNTLIAKDSGEYEEIKILSRIVDGTFPKDKLEAAFKKYPKVHAAYNQSIDYLDLFNTEVDTIIPEWTDDELEEYYNVFLEKQGVVDKYKSPEVASTPVEEDVDFKDSVETVSTPDTSEAEYDYSTSDLEESSILNDDEFSDLGKEDEGEDEFNFDESEFELEPDGAI